MEDLIIYGSYGYTGRLIVKLCTDKGLRPLLCGRDEEVLLAQSKETGLDFAVCSLAETELLHDLVAKAKVVLHCAGPFHKTAHQMIAACLEGKTHYLDITGEIDVFEYAKSLDAAAQEKGIMLMPGVGFDVVPSDCMAAYAKSQMPDAEHLDLCFYSIGGRVSHGTANTAIEHLKDGGAIRKDGKIKKISPGSLTRKVNFDGKPLSTVAIPWGDVSTAYYSTGIPNIQTFFAFPPKAIKRMRWMKYLNWVVNNSVVQARLKSRIQAMPAGPNEEERANSSSIIIAETRNKQGETKSSKLTAPNGYSLTAATALKIAEKVIANQYKAGFQTPSLAYGSDFILEFEGVERIDL